MDTKSPACTGRSTPRSDANRSRSPAMYSSTSSGVTSALSTVTDMAARSGRSNLGWMSTSAVNASSCPSSSRVISTSGCPSASTWLSASAFPYSSGTASFTACSSTTLRPSRWSIIRGGTCPGRKPGILTCLATSR